MKGYEYAKDLDILYIHNNSENEKVAGNLVIGNMVLDVGKNGKVLGVEIDCASKFFKFPAEQFKNLKTAKIEVIKFSNMITLGIVLATNLKERFFQFAIPRRNNAPVISC